MSQTYEVISSVLNTIGLYLWRNLPFEGETKYLSEKALKVIALAYRRHPMVYVPIFR